MVNLMKEEYKVIIYGWCFFTIVCALVILILDLFINGIFFCIMPSILHILTLVSLCALIYEYVKIIIEKRI